MRSEQEMYQLILNIAKKDDRIRAVILNGSRANPNAATDLFQDFDIVYIVTEMTSFKSDPTWIDQFGTSGCVGCGRCITWCPVGIDLTEEISALCHPPQ